MKTFGIGMSRTGTGSLFYAMRELGYKSFHYILQKQWDLIIQEKKEFDFLNDMPVYFRYQELDEKFPNSKFIFTTRDIDSWLHSAEQMWVKQRVALVQNTSDFGIFTKEFFGVKYFDRQVFIDTYWSHKAGVEDYFKDRPQDLLEMDFSKGDDWKKLRAFVGHTGPKPTIPFPHRNRGIKKS